MKKLLIVTTIWLLTVSAKAQLDSSGNYKIPSTVIMPDGSEVRTNLDSIKKVFGGRDIIFSFLADGLHVHPEKNNAEELESETKLHSLLNKPAPGFAYNDMNGKLYSLASLKGKVVVLNFWFTQCGGCIREMPALNELEQDYSSKGVVFLAITYDDIAKIKAFLSKKRFDYTIIPNADKMCTDYAIFGYPTSFVIDRAGVVKFINSSIDSDIKSELTAAINKIKVQ